MASQGPNSPGTAVNDNSYGSDAWINPTYVFTSNSTVSFSRTYPFSTTISNYLKATNFGFSIPSGATIDGILIEVERACSENSASDYTIDSRVRIVKSDGTIGSTDKADTITKWTTSFEYKSYGGSSDLWGETWDSSDINDADFGFVISVSMVDNNKSLYSTFIDHVRITVYYTEGGSSSAIKSVNGLAKASVKSVNGLAIASVKNINGLA